MSVPNTKVGSKEVQLTQISLYNLLCPFMGITPLDGNFFIYVNNVWPGIDRFMNLCICLI